MAILITDTADHRIAFELAQGFEEADKIWPRYGLSKEEWNDLRRSKQFRLLVEHYLAEMQKDGSSFRNKAGVLAEELLYVAHSIASNPDVAADTRVSTLQWLAKVSGKDESANKTKTNDTPGFMIQINMGEPQQQMTYIPPVKTIENE